MSWLITILSAYLILAAVSLGDKYLLSGKPEPKVYSFYVGLLGSLAFLLIPFVDFSVPGFNQIVLSLISGAFSIFALYFLFSGLKKFEASRVIPAIGGLVPVFTFLLTFVFFKEELKDIPAFILFVLGSVLITYNKKAKIPLKSLLVSSVAAIFFASHFILSKHIYLEQSFWSGFILMRAGAIIVSFFLVFTKEVRKEIFLRKPSFDKKTGSFFLLNQGAGAGAFVLQHFAVYLAAPVYLPIIAALQGTQYVFLFIFTILLSFKAPWIIKEETGKGILFQKALAIFLIILGFICLK